MLKGACISTLDSLLSAGPFFWVVYVSRDEHLLTRWPDRASRIGENGRDFIVDDETRLDSSGMIPLDWEPANCHLSQGADYTPMTGLEPSDLKARRALQYENESTFGNSSSAISLVNPSGKLGVLSSLVTDRTPSPARFRIACREQFFHRVLRCSARLFHGK